MLLVVGDCWRAEACKLNLPERSGCALDILITNKVRSKANCDLSSKVHGSVLVGLSGRIICSNRQQYAHAIKYVIWALLSASSMREQ
jgi:hypothetical protein